MKHINKLANVVKFKSNDGVGIFIRHGIIVKLSIFYKVI